LNLGGFQRIDHSTTVEVYEMASRAQNGPVILILGDSFTHPFPPMIAASGGRAIWLHHNSCGFDWHWIEKFRPDQVWYMPTERFFPCDVKNRPAGMPAAGAMANEAPKLPARW
jgi:hypothetical protein